MIPRRSHLAVLALASGTLLACGGGESPDAGAGEADTAAMSEPMAITVAGVGFATPESVLHDPVADVYLVSNINGAPLDADGNGFISRLSPEGEVLALKWIDGAAEGVTLSAPKGMALQGDLLYVTDIDCIRTFDRATGAPAGETCVEGASFLNDLAPHSEGGVVFTDTGLDASFSPVGTDAVYHLADGQVSPILQDAEMGAPNGVAVAGGEAWVVTWSGEVFRIAADGARVPVTRVEGAQFDGVEALADGRVLISNWTSSCVHVLTTDGSLECLVGDVEAPADIGVDASRNRLLIPLFNANEVRIHPIG